MPIADIDHSQQESGRFVDIERIKKGRWQPRRVFDEEKLRELAESIDEVGVIEPLIVRFDKRDGLFEIIAGERRWRAAQMAMLHQVPVIVRNDLSDDQARSMALIENLQREDLNSIEEAEGIHAFIEQLGLTHKQAGERLGKSRPYISNSLRLLELNPFVQEFLREGKLEPGHAKHILTLPSRLQIDLAKMAVRNEWSVRQISKRAGEMRALLNKEAVEGEGIDPDIRRFEREISEHFSMPTTISFDQKHGKGSLTIEWYSMDELCGLLESWGLKEEGDREVKRR